MGLNAFKQGSAAKDKKQKRLTDFKDSLEIQNGKSSRFSSFKYDTTLRMSKELKDMLDYLVNLEYNNIRSRNLMAGFLLDYRAKRTAKKIGNLTVRTRDVWDMKSMIELSYTDRARSEIEKLAARTIKKSEFFRCSILHSISDIEIDVYDKIGIENRWDKVYNPSAQSSSCHSKTIKLLDGYKGDREAYVYSLRVVDKKNKVWFYVGKSAKGASLHRRMRDHFRTNLDSSHLRTPKIKNIEIDEIEHYDVSNKDDSFILRKEREKAYQKAITKNTTNILGGM